jgi:hypothetical protein
MQLNLIYIYRERGYVPYAKISLQISEGNGKSAWQGEWQARFVLPPPPVPSL